MPKYLKGVKKKNGQTSVPADDMKDMPKKEPAYSRTRPNEKSAPKPPKR